MATHLLSRAILFIRLVLAGFGGVGWTPQRRRLLMAWSGQAKALFAAGTLAALALILILNEKYDVTVDSDPMDSMTVRGQHSSTFQFHDVPGGIPPHRLSPPEDARPYWARKVDNNYTRWLDTLAIQGYVS